MKNELSAETSPYLLQHAHNPVHWQSWGTNALDLAKKYDKPILVSIGYSACHWCHVMEKESFENDAVAGIMNEHFINIKIDREERPDIDHIYMDAVQAMTGSGGWPLNVFLTPDGKPFYGGTYFPPVKAHNRASWTDVLLSISDAWKNKRDELEQQGEQLKQHIEKSNNLGQLTSKLNIPVGEKYFKKEDCISITENLLKTADVADGGFGNAPKFPQTFSINVLLQSTYFLKDIKALEHAELSLQKMLNGGIYDQLAGGLCRYSTDAAWLAPHFEKMLYDNALFIIALSNAFLLTKNDIYKRAVTNVCDFIFNEMKDSKGGFYAAIDADSEGEEGKFYVWDKAEVDEILGDDTKFFSAYFDITEHGNWEEKNILRILNPLSRVAANFKMDINAAEDLIMTSKEKLLGVRNKRIRPGTDDKILLGWNAMLITAFCKAYSVTGDEKYKSEAVILFDFIESSFQKNGAEYHHTYKNEEAKYPAFLDDYAYLIDACIHLQEITSDQNYLLKAKLLTEFVMLNFSCAQSEYFYFTRQDQKDIIVRKIEIYDGATPSANSVMAKNLLYLSLVFENKEWHQQAETMLFSLKNIIVKHPGSFGIWASAAMNMAAGINEIVVIGNSMMPLVKDVLLQYLPNKIIQSAKGKNNMPLLSQRADPEKTLIYLCKNYVCKVPVENVKKLMVSVENALFND
jgi:uncharacterized protein